MANNAARNNGKNSFAVVIFNSIKSQRGARGWRTRCSPFADLRKRVYIRSFTWTGSRTFFLAVLPSSAKEKRRRMSSQAFSFRIHLDAYRRAPSQDAFPLIPFSFPRGKKREEARRILSFLTQHDVYIHRLRGSFLSTYSWRAWKSSDKARLSLSLSFF